MQKKYKMKDLDCANCAAKMEALIKKIPGVHDASMNFLMQKLTLDVEDGANLDAILDAAQKACSKIEPDCKIVR